MNIFYISTNPVRAAQMQCNKHVVKMILESAQMLCTAHHEFGNHDVPYKVAHRNHPSTIWARSGLKQYNWLYRHFAALSDEYTERYGKVHLTWQKCAHALSEPPMGIPNPILNGQIPHNACPTNANALAVWRHTVYTTFSINHRLSTCDGLRTDNHLWSY